MFLVLLKLEKNKKVFDLLRNLCYNRNANSLQQKRNGGMKMKLWKKVLAAVTAGVLCVGSAGLSGVQQIALAAYAETTSVLAVPDHRGH